MKARKARLFGSSDPEIEEMSKKMDYIAPLEFNFHKGHYFYIDPLSQFSVQSLLTRLERFPVLDSQTQLVFTGFNSASVKFFINFNERLLCFLKLLKAMEHASIYSISQLSMFTEQSILELKELPPVEELPSPEELLKKARDLQDRYEKAINRKISLESSILTLSDKAPVKYEEVPWNCEAGIFLWYRDYELRYTCEYPIARIEEALLEHTSRVKLISNELLSYKANYTSEIGHGCYGKIIVYVYPKDKNATQIQDKNDQIKIADEILVKIAQEQKVLNTKTRFVDLKNKIAILKQASIFVNNATIEYHRHRSNIESLLKIVNGLQLRFTPSGSHEVAKEFSNTFDLVNSHLSRSGILVPLGKLVAEVEDDLNIGNSHLANFYSSFTQFK